MEYRWQYLDYSFDDVERSYAQSAYLSGMSEGWSAGPRSADPFSPRNRATDGKLLDSTCLKKAQGYSNQFERDPTDGLLPPGFEVAPGPDGAWCWDSAINRWKRLIRQKKGA